MKAPPFLCAGAVKSCGFDTRSYSGSVRTFPRFPAVCNARKVKENESAPAMPCVDSRKAYDGLAKAVACFTVVVL